MITRLEHGRVVFDLDLVTSGSPVTSRKGRPFRFVAYVADAAVQPLVMLDLVDMSVETFNADGTYLPGGKVATPMDLVAQVEPH